MQERSGDITRHWRLKMQRSQLVASRNPDGGVVLQQSTISGQYPTEEHYDFSKPQAQTSIQEDQQQQALSQAAD